MNKKSYQYIIFICLISWLIAGAAILLGLHFENGYHVVFSSVYMCLPAICAIIMQIIHREKPLKDLLISFRLNWWFLAAGVVPAIYAFIALGIILIFPNVSFSYSQKSFLGSLPFIVNVVQRQVFPVQLLCALIVGSTVNAFPAFGEELGWRGYLLKALADKHFLIGSLITGIVWGLWHFPFILMGLNYPEYPIAGIGMMTMNCVLMCPMMAYITIKSKSVIAAAVFHGNINAFSGFSIYSTGSNDLINATSQCIALLLVNFAFFLFDKYITKENIFTRKIGSILT